MKITTMIEILEEMQETMGDIDVLVQNIAESDGEVYYHDIKILPKLRRIEEGRVVKDKSVAKCLTFDIRY